MGLIVNNKIWQLTEKLYIHCYGIDGFVSFLESHEVKLPDGLYDNFEIYSFMSTEQNQFTQQMQGVPSYRYIPILEKIVFDEKIKNTQRDNWNYYGTYIRGWYPKLIRKLEKNEVNINNRKHRLYYMGFEAVQIQADSDFLRYNFNDPFLDYIKKEINETYHNRHYLAVMVLIRKLIECLAVRICEVVFRKYDGKGYNSQNHSLWFNKTKNRVHDLDVLLENLRTNSAYFHEDKDFVGELCALIKPLKNEINRIVHRDYKIPNYEDVNKWDIPKLLNKLRRLYRKYCNL